MPIIADEAVDPAFGTGAVKITPAHDADGPETGRRHGLADDRRHGRRRHDQRRRAARTPAWIGTRRAQRDPARPRRSRRPRWRRAPRAGHRALPALERRRRAAPQDPVVRPDAAAGGRALEATRSGRTRILPERFEKVWEHWLTEIRDWNVSRQLWWGHRIPAWYCPDGHVDGHRAEGGPPACEACGRPAAELTQDPDIFDTWFSSGLWPFSTLGWPDDTPDLRPLLPGLGHGDRLRHHLLLGRPDDDARASTSTGETPVPDGLPVRPDQGSVRQEDVEDEGQRRRPARGASTSRAPTRSASPSSTARRRATTSVRVGEARERPQLREQALERDPLRPRRPAGHDPGGRRARTAPDDGSARPGRALDPVADGRVGRPPWTGPWPTSSSPR